MSFTWPLALVTLIVVPALLIAYPVLVHRRRRSAVVHSSVALIRSARPARASWRRHLPFAFIVAALACLGLAGAKPQVSLPVPAAGSAVILALDVSGSMCATDVDPNRLSAAQAAVKEFVSQQDGSTRIGLVVFSGFAEVAVPPTTQRKALLDTVDGLTTGRGTTIGAAILKSVDAITEIDPDVRRADQGAQGAGGLDAPGLRATPTPTPAAATQKAPEIVVLLTDGANTAGVEPVPAARVAAASGVRIYPIGFGTSNPTSLACTAKQLGGSGFGTSGTFLNTVGASNFLVADDTTLKQVAAITGGTFFSASDSGQLRNVLKDLPRHVATTRRHVQISAGFAALGVVLLLLGCAAAARYSTFPD